MTSHAHGFTALLMAALLVGCSPGGGQSPTADASTAPVAQAAEPVAPGAWRLDGAASRLSFTSIKNNTVTEVHHFEEVSGTVDSDGNATVQIVLDSVRTGIDIRDQRMREMLFETGRFALATAQLSVDPAAVKALAPGEHRLLRTDVALDLHGLTNRLPAELRITRLDDRAWLVTSEQPLVVDATRFGLINGIDALRQVAGLQSIGSGVPVSLTLRFTGG